MSSSYSRPILPLEVLREVIEQFYSSEVTPSLTRVHTRAEVGVSAALPWKSLASLRAASKACREIALETWLETLQVNSPSDLEAGLSIFPAIASRTRYLHCTLKAPWSSKLFDLRDFRNLKAIRVDQVHYRDLPVHSGPWGFLNAKDLSPFQLFQNPPPGIQEFHISSKSWERFPSRPSTFISVQAFKNLRILSLRMQKTWCDLCGSDQELVIAKPAPDTIVYQGGIGLPLKFSEALSGMKQLEVVLLTVAIHHSVAAPRVVPLFNPVWNDLALQSFLGENGVLWSGECARCIQVHQWEENFCSEWVRLKKGQEPLVPGVIDVKHRHHRIRSLERVEWHFDSLAVPRRASGVGFVDLNV